MKLFYTPIPDLIHKAQVVAIEAGLYDKIERIPTNPFNRDPAHIAANPLSKVPTLVLDDGTPLYGGPVIYEYLDSLHSGPKMFPPSGMQRWLVLRLLALGDGMWDVAVQRSGEADRPAEFVHQEQLDKHDKTLARALDRLNVEAADFKGFDIGQISVACGLMYFDRVRALGRAKDDWRSGRPALTAWYEAIRKRPSMQPHDNDFRAAMNAGDRSSRRGYPKK